MNPGDAIETAGARYGLLGIGVVVLAFVCVFLGRLYLQLNAAVGREREAMVKEREEHKAALAAEREAGRAALAQRDAAHAVELAEVEAECQADRRAEAERYAKELAEHVKQAREETAQIRRENAETSEKFASEIAAMSARSNATMDKLTDRLFVQQRRPDGRY